MKEYTKRDSCMTMEEVIERNTGMSLKAFLTPQPNPYMLNSLNIGIQIIAHLI